MSFPAFLDTCTIFGAALTDLLLELADQGAFRPLWSKDVLGELERVVVERRRVDPAAIASRIRTMREVFPDAEVKGYEDLVDQMTCDAGDRHVVAAAVRANAEVIVTFNVKHFPRESLEPYDLEAVHPDEFLLDQLDLYRRTTLTAVDAIAAAYESPPMTTEEFLGLISKSGAPKFAARVLDEL